MRLLVTGARGLLGREVVAVAGARGHDVLALGRTDLDVTDPDAVRAAVDTGRPDAVVHLAAYTAVDRAEAEPESARAVNAAGTANVAGAARAVGAALLYVSTDYVFDGAKRAPYRPGDEPRPLSVYGATKLEGERAALGVPGALARGGSGSAEAARPDALVVRASWLYGAGGRSFVTSMLERAGRGEPLRVVDDQTGTPTWARNTAAGALELLERGARGVWHVADGGSATWLELAREALRLRGLDAPVEGVSTAAWGAAALRPPYSVLDVSATEAMLGRPATPWRTALAAFLDEVDTDVGTAPERRLTPGGAT